MDLFDRNNVSRLFNHLWLDVNDTHRAVPDAMAERLQQRIVASEALHRGELRVCVESSLPLAELWPAISGRAPLGLVVRQRALGWFGRLRVWDTEHNNGVLIYLLLAERAIEIVADRALVRQISAQQWQTVIEGLGERLKSCDFEAGLGQAIDEVSAMLVQHFPMAPRTTALNELDNAVIRV